MPYFTSDAWNYFEKIDSESAKCRECSKKIKCKGGSTKGLNKHLKNIHNIPKPNSEKRLADDEPANMPPIKKLSQPTIFKFMIKKESLSEIVAKLVVVDGFTINGVIKSDFIRSSIKDRGFTLPKNSSSVMKLVHEHYEKLLKSTKSEIQELVESETKFSITFDEYSSCRNRKYLNINLHGPSEKVWNLGLVRVIGSCTAVKLLPMVTDKLACYGLRADLHIISATTDGASVMVRVGKDAEWEHHICLLHGIHLAVTAVLYSGESSGWHDEDDEQEEEDDEDDEDDDDEDDDEDDGDNETMVPDYTPDYKPVIQKVRKVVRAFRRSSKKNDKLQEHVVAEFGKEMQLVLDCKQRWNSLESMFSTFLRLRNPLCKAMIDLKIKLTISDDDFTVIQDILSALTPVKLCAEALGRKDATLLTAEGAFTFVLDTLHEQKTVISKELLETLEARIHERRPHHLTSLMKFLTNPESYHDHQGRFENPSKSVLVKTAKTLMSRLFSSVGDEKSDSAIQEQEQSTSEPESLKFKLEKAISFSNSTPTKASDHEFKSLMKEFNLYEITGKITPNLALLLSALKIIKPSSVESERVFSTVSQFVTKIRSRLSDKSINSLVFLKS